MRGLATLLTACGLASHATAHGALGDRDHKHGDDTPTLIEVSGGHTWLENLAFDGYGNLFFTDAFAGTIFKVTTANDSSYVTTPHITGLDAFGALGLAASAPGAAKQTMYAVALVNGTNQLISFSADTPNAYSVVATAPTPVSGIYELNGLALDYNTSTFITTSLGHLQAGDGVIYTGPLAANNSANTTLAVWKTGLSGSDGLWLDRTRRLAYVTELLSATVLVYDLDSGALVNSFTAPGVVHLDDFTLDASGAYLYGADLYTGSVVRFSSNATVDRSYQVIVSGLQNVTSVRFGAGPGFAPTSLFITEGGGQAPGQATRRLLELRFGGGGGGDKRGAGAIPLGVGIGVGAPVGLGLLYFAWRCHKKRRGGGGGGARGASAGGPPAEVVVSPVTIIGDAAARPSSWGK